MFLFILILCSATQNAQDLPKEIKEQSSQIRLKTRTVDIKNGIDVNICAKLQEVLKEKKQNSYVLIHFAETPTPELSQSLKENGVELLSYVSHNIWYAYITNPSFFSTLSIPTSKNNNKQLQTIDWIDEIRVGDKLSPNLKNKNINKWVLSKNGYLQLLIRPFKNIDSVLFDTNLKKTGAEIIGCALKNSVYMVSIPETKITDLANLPEIKWIEPLPGLPGPEVNNIRLGIGVDNVQTLGYKGTNVKVGVFEDSHAYLWHPDLERRIFQGDNDPYNQNYHAACMAGLIAGDGNGSNNNIWRGIAPEAIIYTYDFSAGNNTAEKYLNYLGDLENGLLMKKITIANNSWGTIEGCGVHYNGKYGYYEGICNDLDKIVSGSLGTPLNIVFSGGNERDGWGNNNNTNCILNKVTPFQNYGTLNHPKAAKNIITVGAIDYNGKTMSAYSSWGPTIDGRLKPDIVSFGHNKGGGPVTNPTESNHLFTAASYNAAYPDNYYLMIGQTSAAAATVSGCLALLEQAIDSLYPELYQKPLPSTYKMLLIHNAIDLDNNTDWYNKGPDYASGFGLINMTFVIDYLKRSGNYFKFYENQVKDKNQASINFWVNATYPQVHDVKVTLVWDDPAASELAEQCLINDLDLVVIDPNGKRYYPWKLDPNNPSAQATRGQSDANIDLTEYEDHLNNVEQVYVDDLTGIPNGYWEVRVEGYHVPIGPQRFSLAVSGILGKVNNLVENGDGTISDPSQNKMWIKDANLAICCEKNATWKGAGWFGYDGAKTWIENLSIAGYRDWRLPKTYGNNYDELSYLYHDVLGNPYNWPPVNLSVYKNFENLMIRSDYIYYNEQYQRDTIQVLHSQYWNKSMYSSAKPAINLITGKAYDYFMTDGVTASAWAVRDINETTAEKLRWLDFQLPIDTIRCNSGFIWNTEAMYFEPMIKLNLPQQGRFGQEVDNKKYMTTIFIMEQKKLFGIDWLRPDKKIGKIFAYFKYCDTVPYRLRYPYTRPTILPRPTRPNTQFQIPDPNKVWLYCNQNCKITGNLGSTSKSNPVLYLETKENRDSFTNNTIPDSTGPKKRIKCM